MGNCLCTGRKDKDSGDEEHQRPPPTWEQSANPLLGSSISPVAHFDPETETPNEFCNRVLVHLQLVCNDLDRAKRFVITLLDGKYRTRVVKRIPEESRFGYDVPLVVFFRDLCEALVSEEEKAEALETMKKVIQEEASVGEYASTFQQLAAIAFPSEGFSGNESEVAQAFLKGLNKNIRTMVMTLAPPRSFEEAKESALKTEKALREMDEEEEDLVPINFVDVREILKTGARAAGRAVRKGGARALHAAADVLNPNVPAVASDPSSLYPSVPPYQ